MANIYDWSTTPGSNATIGSIDWSEGQFPSTVNNSARQEMAHVAAWRNFLGGAKISASANTMTLTSGMTITAYAQGMMFSFECGAANTTAVTLNVDSVGAKAVVKNYNDPLSAGDLVAGGIYLVAYEATADNFQLISTATNPLSFGRKGADVASATALTIGTDGNYFDVTGTATITSIDTWKVGGVVNLHFDGILILTHHATDLILPGGVDITTAAGDHAAFVEYAAGDWRCLWYTRASAGVGDYPTNYLSGMGLTNGTDSDHDVDFAAGYARDSTDSANLIGTALTKQIDAAWTAGDAAGGLFSGTVATTTTYYVFAIKKDSDSSVDYGFDTSSTAANIPSGYTYYRHLDTITTDGSANIEPFTVTSSGHSVQGVWTKSNALNTVNSATYTIPLDDTTPLSSEGKLILTRTITPSSTASKLKWTVSIPVLGGSAAAANEAGICTVFMDGVCVGVSAIWQPDSNEDQMNPIFFMDEEAPATLSEVTFTVRFGATGGIMYLNGTNAGTRVFGGSARFLINVEEITG
jgi:hypothetical protein